MNGPGLEGGDVDLPDVVPFEASEATHAAFAAIGRTEDVKFSPDNRRLAIAGFATSTVLLLDVKLGSAEGRRTIRLANPVAITSPELQEPHGVAFIDDEHIIVANRAGLLSIFRLPPRGTSAGAVTLVPVGLEPGAGFEHLETPGSVAVVPTGRDRYSILVCNNFAHHVTRHRLAWGQRKAVRKNRILLKGPLNIPDGIAVSPSRRWIAVSSHVTGNMLMYRNGKALDPTAEPAGELRGAGYPHGVRFTADGQFVLVADAGNPVVRIYLGTAGTWRGSRDPVGSLRVVTQEAYVRGRYNPEEGGPKGIDVDGGTRVLAVTCAEQPLVFFDLRKMLDRVARRRA